MAEDENVLKASKELYAASKVARLTPSDNQKLDGFSYIVNKNRQLLSLPQDSAREEFLKLDENLQNTLRKFNPNAEFAKEEDPSVFGVIKEKVIEPALTNIGKYASRLTEPYRAIRTSVVEDIPLTEAWKLAYDGNALFDKQREKKVDLYYRPEVSKIAKQIATGSTIGEILTTLETPKEIQAMRELLEGSPEFERAIKDYDTAKISVGRDLFYEAFDIDPGEFGANRFAFNRLSGAADLATQIFFDPITYIPIVGQAYKASQLSILKIAEASGDVLNLRLNRAFDTNTILGRGVTRFFDEIGADIQRLNQATDTTQRADIRSQIRNKFNGDIDEIGIDQLLKGQVFNAQDAKQFLQDADNAMGLINGKAVKAEPILPTYGVIQQFKNNIRQLTNTAIGVSKVKVVDQIDLNKTDIMPFLEDNLVALKTGNQEEIVRLGNVVRNSQTFASRFARLFEIAPKIGTIKTGLKVLADGRTVDEGLSSVKNVRALSRTAGFSKEVSDRIASIWAEASQGQRIKIRDGIVATMANNMGLSSTASGREVLNRTINFLTKEQYALVEKVTPQYIASLGKLADEVGELIGPDGKIDPSTLGGNVSKAAALWQLKDEVTIPPIHEWYREAYKTKNWFMKSMGPLFNNRVSTGLVDAWSFLTLIPRLGIRSAIEEAMMFGFVAPTQAMKSLFTDGFKASRALRRIRNIDKTGGYLDAGQLSLPMRAWYNISQKGITKELVDAVKNAKNGKDIAKPMAIAMKGSSKPLARLSKEKNTKYAEDFFEFVYGSKAWDDISVAASQGVNFNLDRAAEKGFGTAEAVAKFYGDVAEFSTSLARNLENKVTSGPFGPIAVKTDAYYINWQIDHIKNAQLNGVPGRIALENLEDMDNAVRLITDYLDKNKGLREKFANAYDGEALTSRKLATILYLKTAQIYRRADGSISKELVDLFRTKQVLDDGTVKYFIKTDVDADALKALPEEALPETVLGRQFVPVAKGQGGLIKAIQERGYSWMDRQIATLTREPFFYANWQAYRQKLNGVELKKFNQLKDKLGEETAKRVAAEYVSNAAADLATKRTLDFVDNPNVRTNLAWSMRNFARFWRATEDFYRRAYRTAIKNPESLVKLRIASDGLEHAGFIHENEDGEKYFIFPGDDILTAIISPVTTLLTGKPLQTPMPLEFTGKIKMLSPSLDPESSIPTLSGPLSGVSMMTLQRMLPNFMGPVKDRILGVALGPRSQNARWTDVLMPSNVRRAVDALNQDERDSQFASAARKAIVYLQANGQGLSLNATEGEKLEFRQKVEGVAANIVVTRFFLGLLSPVAPQVGFGKDIPDYLKDAGNVNFKSEFNKLVNEIAMTGETDVYNKALAKWTAINPGLLAYTIGETDANKIAAVKKTDAAAKWVRGNRDLIKKYPEGSAFFIPFVGEFNFDDYTFLKREGYTEAVPVEDFFKRVTVAEDRRNYYETKKSFDERIENTPNPSLRGAIRDEWATFKEDFLKDKPLLVQDLETRQSKQQIVNTLEDLRSMIESGDAPKNDLARKYKQMIDVYDNADTMLSLLTGNTKIQRQQKEMIRQNAYQKIQQISQGDPQAEMAVRVLFEELLGV